MPILSGIGIRIDSQNTRQYIKPEIYCSLRNDCFHGYHVSLWHHACSSDHFLPAAAAASQHSLTPSQQINGGSDMMTTHGLLLVVAGRADNIAAGHMTPTLPPSMGPVHVHPPFRLVGDQQLWKVVLKQSRLRVGLSLLPSVLCSY